MKPTMSRNGVCSGTVKTGYERALASSSSAGGTFLKTRSMPMPSAAMPPSSSSVMSSRWALALPFRRMPVVSITQPRSRKRVGSSTSMLCAPAISRPSASSPLSSARPRSSCSTSSPRTTARESDAARALRKGVERELPGVVRPAVYEAARSGRVDRRVERAEAALVLRGVERRGEEVVYVGATQGCVALERARGARVVLPLDVLLVVCGDRRGDAGDAIGADVGGGSLAIGIGEREVVRRVDRYAVERGERFGHGRAGLEQVADDQRD